MNKIIEAMRKPDSLLPPEIEQTQKYALFSVSDKTGIVDFAKVITSLGYQIISTGGTAKVLTENNIPVIPIQEITDNPESFDGRMKTISFEIESGILFDRNNPSHAKEAKELGIKPIDIVVCNLYPFEQEQTIENIDVGGPTMIRAAAKNFENVLVIVDKNDYEDVTDTLKKSGVDLTIRQKLAAKAFVHLSLYDSQVARFLGKERFPDELTIPGRKVLDLRYGENPHQKAALYLEPNTNSLLARLERLAGRELSLINITDINAGIESVRLFDEPCAVVIKHNTPCGIALGEIPSEALSRAIEADPESAFGGVVVLNQEMDILAAKHIKHIDIIAAPEFDEDALTFLKSVRKTMGIYSFGEIPKQRSNPVNIKCVDGGFTIQEADDDIEGGFKDWEVVTEKEPTQKELEQMKIAWKFISRIKSNAIIVIDKNIPMTRGIGSGQTSRIRSTKIALEQAGKFAKGGVLASDSFFPFDDSVKLATKAGITAIVQQGGSINDKLSIDAANKAGIAMVFTGRRAFWH